MRDLSGYNHFENVYHLFFIKDSNNIKLIKNFVSFRRDRARALIDIIPNRGPEVQTECQISIDNKSIVYANMKLNL